MTSSLSTTSDSAVDVDVDTDFFLKVDGSNTGLKLPLKYQLEMEVALRIYQLHGHEKSYSESTLSPSDHELLVYSHLSEAFSTLVSAHCP